MGNQNMDKDMGTEQDAREKSIASKPGEQVKDWMEKEKPEFEDDLTTPKAMAEDTTEGKRS